MGERLDPNSIKKTVKVRKLQENAATCPGKSENGESSSSSNNNPECGTSLCEEEMQVIEVDDEEKDGTKSPILLMFPSLRQEGLNTDKITEDMSTSDITKLLIGQKAQMTHLKFSRRLRRPAIDFAGIPEEDEHDESSAESLEEKPPKKIPSNATRNSADADVSDNEEESKQEQ